MLLLEDVLADDKMNEAALTANELISNFSGSFVERFNSACVPVPEIDAELPQEIITQVQAIFKTLNLPELPVESYQKVTQLCSKYPELTNFLKSVQDKPFTPTLLLSRLPDLLNIFTVISENLDEEEDNGDE